MSISALTDAIDAFAANDLTLRDTLIAQLDAELGEIEAERAKANAAFDARRARVADRKVGIDTEFDARRADLDALLNGRP